VDGTRDAALTDAHLPLEEDRRAELSDRGNFVTQAAHGGAAAYELVSLGSVPHVPRETRHDVLDGTACLDDVGGTGPEERHGTVDPDPTGQHDQR
jgi:hypothetical protein